VRIEFEKFLPAVARAGSRHGEKFFEPPQQGRTGKGKSTQTKQSVSYKMRPLAESAFNTTNRYQIMFYTTKKDKNICA
jgi:hypothetical protein